MIRTVIFDIGEVIFNGYYGIEKEISERLGTSIPFKTLQTDELTRYFEGRMLETEFWRLMIAKFDWPFSIRDLQEIVRRNFKVVPGTIEIVKDLKKHGFVLGVLSVHSREWVKHLESLHEYECLFDYLGYSFQSGICKPDPRAFISVASALQCQPHECLFIDDMSKNIMAAEALGFHTHHFSSSEKLRYDLVNRGMLPFA